MTQDNFWIRKRDDFMLIVQDVLISDDAIKEFFHCQFDLCKGACCWEGDFGAPLEEDELKILEALLPKIKPFLDNAALEVMKQSGISRYYKEQDSTGTNLMDDGACVFMIRQENGIAKCGIEKAYENREIDFKKPISCHLYPVRVAKNKESGFLALNYDQWEICSPACLLGKKQKIRVYQFVKEALIRKFGAEFYDELDALVQWVDSKTLVSGSN